MTPQEWQWFNEFWVAYPRKSAKPVAMRSFATAITKTAISTMLRALSWQKQTQQWLEGIIPLPATWLNQERWDDEPPTTPKLSSKGARNMKAIFGEGDF